MAYKNLTFQGKVEGRKIMAFGPTAETFKVLAVAQVGEVYEVDAKKNDQSGYIEWLSAKKSSGPSGGTTQDSGLTKNSSPTGSTPQPTAVYGNASPKSTYETPEERAKKQIYIVRQSSLSTAVDALSIGAKTPPKINEIIETAKQFEDYVFGTNSSIDSGLPHDIQDSEIE